MYAFDVNGMFVNGITVGSGIYTAGAVTTGIHGNVGMDADGVSGIGSTSCKDIGVACLYTPLKNKRTVIKKKLHQTHFYASPFYNSTTVCKTLHEHTVLVSSTSMFTCKVSISWRCRVCCFNC